MTAGAGFEPAGGLAPCRRPGGDLDRGGDGIAERSRLADPQRRDGLVDVGAILRRRRDDLRQRAEGDDRDAVGVGQLARGSGATTAWAAASLVGATSRAPIERDVSIAMIDGRLLRAHRERGVRSREPDEEARHGQQQQRCRADACARRGTRSTTFGSSAGWTKRAAWSTAPVLEPEVAGHRQGHQDQRDQGDGGREAHCAPACRRNPVRSRSQSPSVRSTTWRAPAEAISRRHLAALQGGRGGEARAQPLARGVDLHLPARLGIDEPQLAEPRQLLLAHVADLDRHDVMPAAEHEERPPPVARAAEVGHDHDVGALAGEVADALEGVPHRRRRAGGPPRLPVLLLAQREQQAEQARPPLPRGQRARMVVAERDEAEPVAAAGGRVARWRARRPPRRPPCGARPCRTSSTARCRAGAR